MFVNDFFIVDVVVLLMVVQNRTCAMKVISVKLIAQGTSVIFYSITFSAVIPYADWIIGVRSGAVLTLYIQYRTAEFNIERRNSILPLGLQSDP